VRRYWVDRTLQRALAAEAIGTFALVFAGAGAIMVDAKTHALGHVGVAISFGLVIMVMIYAVGHISGAHFNAFVLSRHFPWQRALGYWLAQLIGALTAAAILRGSLGDVAHVGATLPSGSQGQSFLWELVMSVFLMFVIMAVATDTSAVGEAAAIAIDGTIGLDAMFGGPISGASMNPMRSLGPALSSATFTRSGSTSSRRSSAPRSAPFPISSSAVSQASRPQLRNRVTPPPAERRQRVCRLRPPRSKHRLRLRFDRSSCVGLPEELAEKTGCGCLIQVNKRRTRDSASVVSCLLVSLGSWIGSSL
jgi:aquaporin NIP